MIPVLLLTSLLALTFGHNGVLGLFLLQFSAQSILEKRLHSHDLLQLLRLLNRLLAHHILLLLLIILSLFLVET